LTEQITAYAGSQRGERTTVNLNDLIVENTTFFSTAFPSTVTLTHHLAANLPAIHADATQMQQIIMNLIINAVEAVDESTGRITLRTYETSVSAEQSHTWAYVTELPPDGNLICLEVGDNGCGMDSETVQRIFDPLFTTKSSQSSGRGLGLVAVSRIVRDHRGGMGIITQPDVGSTFRIFLPPKPAFL
jgi:signal transduction histidine kinase